MSGLSDAVRNEFNPVHIPAYYGAFHPYQLTLGVFILFGIIGEVTNSFGSSITWAVILFAPIWLACVMFVNRTYQGKIDAFSSAASSKGRKISGAVGEDSNSYTIKLAYGRVRAARPYRVIAPITIIVGDSSVLVYDDATLHLDLLRAEFGNSTREFFFDSIASVNYDDPYFEIKLSDGDQAQYRSSRKPDDVLHELQQRIRDYKRQSVNSSG